MAILRRTAAGAVLVTRHAGGVTITYEDGAKPSLKLSRGDCWPGEHHFRRLVDEGWLVPDRSSQLFDDSGLAQVYHARRP